MLSLVNAPMEDRLNVVHSRNPTWFDQAEILVHHPCHAVLACPLSSVLKRGSVR
jgi:hypothetical protein